MRLVPIECVKNGSYLAKTIFDMNGKPLLKADVKLNSKILKKIEDIGIYLIYIHDEYSEKEIDDLIKPQIRKKAIKIIKDTFSNIKKYISNYDNKDFHFILEIAKELLDEILSKKNVLVNLVDIKVADNYTYQHCVNVGVLSLVIGIKYSLKKSELLDLCVGALLHDIGKVFIPKDILNKAGPLTDKEFNVIKKHTTIGYDYIKHNINISLESKLIILEHHEKINGKGYPFGKKGDEIHQLAKIVAIADVYDALTSDRPYRKAMTPNEALEYILGNGGAHFDYNMVRVFSSCIIPYPEGTLVKLSSGDTGIVSKVYPNFPLRPKIKLVNSYDKSKIGTFINLMDTLDITIQGVDYTH